MSDIEAVQVERGTHPKCKSKVLQVFIVSFLLSSYKHCACTRDRGRAEERKRDILHVS